MSRRGGAGGQTDPKGRLTPTVVGWYHENNFPLIAVGRQRRQLFATEGLFDVIRPLADVHFDGFGVCGFRPRTKPPTEEVLLPADLAAKRTLVRQQCPTVPGVYGMLDPQGELIYVGKSKAAPRPTA